MAMASTSSLPLGFAVTSAVGVRGREVRVEAPVHAIVVCGRSLRTFRASAGSVRDSKSYILQVDSVSLNARPLLDLTRALVGRRRGRGLRLVSNGGRVQASLLGVGAPEALVIAVVALLVFGPKGLAEVARTLGKSLKAFQPTIQELQQVSREFRSTLESEIGLDELRNPKPLDPPGNNFQQPPTQSPSTSQQSSFQNGAPEAKAYTTEDYVRVTAEQAKALVPEEKRKEAEAIAWGGTPPTKSPVDDNSIGTVKEQEKSGEETSI